jgi:hypothetical protein
MKSVLVLSLLVLTLFLAGCEQEKFDPSTIKPEDLREIIAEQQRKRVKESTGVWAHECFTDDDLRHFIQSGQPRKIAEALKASPRFMAVVAALKQMPANERQQLLNSCRRPLRPTWAEYGAISPAAQTIAGQRAELLIAEAIVNLVAELISSDSQSRLSTKQAGLPSSFKP